MFQQMRTGTAKLLLFPDPFIEEQKHAQIKALENADIAQ